MMSEAERTQHDEAVTQRGLNFLAYKDEFGYNDVFDGDSNSGAAPSIAPAEPPPHPSVVAEDLDENINETVGAGNDSNDGGEDDEEEEAHFYDEKDKEYEEPQLPDWACRYCGISSTASVVRCLETGQWFCNSTGGTTASHIMQHLVRSKNKEICLHPESPLGETVVECYNCSNRNIFMMGFIPAKGESVVVLLCRNCLGIGALKDLGWNMDTWTPLIKDRQIVDWMVKIPEDKEELRARQITTAQITQLEELWKTNPEADLADLKNSEGDPDENPDEVLLRYEDGYQFQNIFGPLVKLEADRDRASKEAVRFDNLSLRFSVSETTNRTLAEITIAAHQQDYLRLNVGDEMRLTLASILAETDEDWFCHGTVIHISDDGSELVLALMGKGRFPEHVLSGYSLTFVWKAVAFDRMQTAMKAFAVDDSSLSGYLYHRILGHDVEEQILDVKHMPSIKYSVPGLPELNHSQIEALRQVLEKPLSLIQGPPGTGKTVTSASLVYHLAQKKQGQVLVCAPSNVAVDQLTEKIHATGVMVVRVQAKTREHMEELSVNSLCLHTMIEQLGTTQSKRFCALKKKKEDNMHLSKKDQRLFVQLRSSLERKILSAASVICCTCSGAGDPRISRRRFKYLLLDEATQATEPESLIPLVRGIKQFVLVGDHCQLGPVVMCKKAAKAGLNSSLFERLVTLGLRPIRLQVQYRMHPCLSEFPSNTFYEGSLQNGVTASDRDTSHVDFPWINPSKPMMFYVSNGTEEMSSQGTSYLNRAEASQVEKVVTSLLRASVSPHQIGVVTPYEGQRAYIVSHLQRSGPLKLALYHDVEISSVDAFQGREKDYIILSCVRSNEKQGIGFLADYRRLNVAMTRAKYGLIILGNPKVLAKHPLWNSLLVHFREQHLLVEGSLANLQVSLMRFPRTRKYHRDRRQMLFEESAAVVFSGDIYDPYGIRGNASLAPNKDSRYDARYVPKGVPGAAFMPMMMPAYGAHPFGLGAGDYNYVPASMTAEEEASAADESSMGGDNSTTRQSHYLSQMGSQASYDFEYGSQAGDDMSEILSQTG